jgi:hypothetical protein
MLRGQAYYNHSNELKAHQCYISPLVMLVNSALLVQPSLHPQFEALRAGFILCDDVFGHQKQPEECHEGLPRST